MPGLGNDLVVNLAGNNTKLKSAITESKGGLKGFASSAAGFLNPVTAGLAVVAGGAVAAGLAISVLQGNIAKLDLVAKTAARTGLSGKFLQQLEFAADQSGVSAETLTKSVEKMTINIGEAANGSKSAADGFSRLGISVADLESMSPEQQFRTVTEAIAKLPTAADRAAAAVKIFGKSGLEMVTLLNGGVEGLNGLLERATELGIGVDAEGLKKIEAAQDAIGQMKASMGALLDQVTVGLAPAFTFVATTIADMIPPVTKLFDKFNAMEGKAQFLGDLLDASLSVAFEDIKENWDVMLDEMIISAAEAGSKISKLVFSPVTAVGGMIGETIAQVVGGQETAPGETAPGETKLDAARQNLDSVLARLNNVEPFVPQGPQQPVVVPDDGSKLAGLFGGLMDKAGPIADGLKGKLDLALGKVITDGNFWSNLGAKAIGIGGDEIVKEDPPAKMETKFAGAMQKGSSEAFSTVLAAMFGNKNDPNVKATEKQTKELVKAFHAKPPNVFNMLESILT